MNKRATDDVFVVLQADDLTALLLTARHTHKRIAEMEPEEPEDDDKSPDVDAALAQWHRLVVALQNATDVPVGAIDPGMDLQSVDFSKWSAEDLHLWVHDMVGELAQRNANLEAVNDRLIEQVSAAEQQARSLSTTLAAFGTNDDDDENPDG